MTPLKPPALTPGDLVSVCAPSGPVDASLFQTGLETLKTRYRVTVPPGLESRRNGYLAGDDATRREELQEAFADPQVRAVFCARGGYGAMRIVDDLPPDFGLRHPKPLVGFSDITTLLLWLLGQGLVAIHGPVVTQLGSLSPQQLRHLWRLLEDPAYRPVYTASSTVPLNEPPSPSPPPQKTSPLEGVLWGGNLAMLASLVGSPTFEAPPRRGLLAIEEVSEPPYRLDRMITQLHRAGLLQDVSAVVVGQLTAPLQDEAKTASRQKALERTVLARFAELNIPCFVGFPWGHRSLNLAWPLGVEARVVPEENRLELLESPVS